MTDIRESRNLSNPEADEKSPFEEAEAIYQRIASKKEKDPLGTINQFVADYIDDEGHSRDLQNNDLEGHVKGVHAVMKNLEVLEEELDYGEFLVLDTTWDKIEHSIDLLKHYVFEDEKFGDGDYKLTNNPESSSLFKLAAPRFYFTMPWLKSAARVCSPNYESSLLKRFGRGGTKESTEHLFRQLKKLREIYHDIQRSTPELVGLTVFGSTTRGLAKEGSDVDGNIFIMDERMTYEDLAGGGLDRPANLTSTVADSTMMRFTDAMHTKMGIDEFKDFVCFGINDEIVKTVVQRLISGSDSHVTNPYLEALFHMKVGRADELLHFRLLALNEFEKAGEQGTVAWEKFISSFKAREAGIDSKVMPQKFLDKRSYPESISDAKRVFTK